MSLEELDRNHKWHHAEFFGITVREDMSYSRYEALQGFNDGYGHLVPFSGDKRLRQGTQQREEELERRAVLAIAAIPELTHEAMGWAIDAFDLSPDSEWAPKTIARIVHRKYAGGALNFYMSNRALIPASTKSPARPDLEFRRNTRWQWMGCNWVSEQYSGTGADLSAFYNDPRQVLLFLEEYHVGGLAGFMVANRAEFDKYDREA